MISRRHFLQFAGSTLATMGLSQCHIIKQGNRYAQVLAQNTPRKLALLVGINKYPNNQRLISLNGCVMDVDLQRELLIHRFGFNPSNIISLTSDELANKQPTRSNILTAFEEHLIKQAKPGDVVVFHFSGHGSRFPEPDPIQKCSNNDDNFNSTFVPSDDISNKSAQDIMGRTLFLLMSALKTENVTAVLDSCYSGGGTRGNFLVRSVPGDGLNPSPEEIAYQKRWMERLQLSTEELAKRRCASVRKGVVLAAAQRDEEALDAPFDDFHAGAFTYLLTQYLWQQTDKVGSAIARISDSIKWINRQAPLADGNLSQPVYFIYKKVPPTDAVIIKGEGDRATLWLGGVNNESLEGFRKDATFTIVNDSGQKSGQLKMESRSGLTAQALLVSKGASLKPGMLLQESSRVFPTDLKLSIGLDSTLAGEMNAAKQALSKINRIEVVPVQRGNKPYPKEVQYIFGQITADYRQKLQQQQPANLPAVGSIGLFTSELELMPDFFGKGGETVTEAVYRLEPKLKSLLATHIIKKTLNANSSNLDVEVSMNLVDEPNKILAKSSTLRGKNNRRESQQIYSNKLPLFKLFQCRVTNHEKNVLYFTTLLIDSTGDLVVVFPYQWPTTEESMRLEPNQTQLIGDPQKLKLKAIDKGTGEALVIVSRKPLKNAVKTLVALAVEQNRTQGELELKEPVEVIGDLLADLGSDVSRQAAPRLQGGGAQAREVKTSEIATLSIAFEVG